MDIWVVHSQKEAMHYACAAITTAGYNHGEADAFNSNNSGGTMEQPEEAHVEKLSARLPRFALLLARV